VTRTSRARRIASAAAFGGGGIGVLGAAGIGLLHWQARLARRWIGTPFGTEGPGGAGLYLPDTGPHTPHGPLELGILGDSSAVGLGVDHSWQTPGALLAQGLATASGRPVRLRVHAIVGAESSHLPGQVKAWLAACPNPDVAVIMVGANDVTHRIRPADAVRDLGTAVRLIRDNQAEVVVGTCPDLGTIEPLAQPLRYLARRASRELAAAQTIAVVDEGGRTVSLGDLLGPEFETRPGEMFSADRFHPSAAGYRRAASVLLPSVCAALGLAPDLLGPQQPDLRRGEGADDIAHAAARAAGAAGTEVSESRMLGSERGPRGRWAMLLRRRPTPATGPIGPPRDPTAPVLRPDPGPEEGETGR
jgi:lysophospholipase L1-like esterase